MNRLVVATTNAGKIHEVQLALADLPHWCVEPLPRGLPEIDETGSEFLENAELKAVHYSRLIDGLALADDSGLSVRALGGRPGVHSARFGPTAEARNQRVVAELAALGTSDYAATFHCAFAVAQSGNVVWTVQTGLNGKITRTPAGEFGFGYDPVFFVPELGKTLAELTTAEKNQISARGQALIKLRHYLEDGETFPRPGRL